jgi:XRE family aerobic/anaerobic benzoate catabolism transcriptional regulator
LSEGRPLVVAAGGGVVTSKDTFAAAAPARARRCGCGAARDDHWNRVVRQGDRRPMAEHPQAMAELRRLLSAREPLYAEAAHTVDTSKLGVAGAVKAIEALLRGKR